PVGLLESNYKSQFYIWSRYIVRSSRHVILAMRQSSASTLKTEQTSFLAQTTGSAGKSALWRASWSDRYEMSGSDGTSLDPKRNRSTHPPLAGIKSSRTRSRSF